MTKMPVEVGNSDVENLSITISPALSLSGAVRLDGQAVANISTVQVNLRPRDPVTMMTGGPSPTTKVKEDGTFSLANVNADNYYVTVTGLPDGFYVKSVSLGGQDVLAAAKLLKLGRRLAVGEVSLLSGTAPDPIAHVTATYSIPNA